jgi:hypothetical protein
VPSKRSKYDDLVDVLADGLFEILTWTRGPASMATSPEGL